MRYVTGMDHRLDSCRKLFSSLEPGGHSSKQGTSPKPKDIIFVLKNYNSLRESLLSSIGALKKSEKNENYRNENDVWDFNLGAERYITLKLCSSKLF